MAKRDLILNNFWWKMIALFLAIAAWVGFKSRQGDGVQIFPDMHYSFSSRELVSHPISITKPANDTRTYRVQPTTVDITLTGDLKSLRSLDTKEVRATIEVADFSGDSNTLPIKIFLPQVDGIRLEKFAPRKVQVELVNNEPKL